MTDSAITLDSAIIKQMIEKAVEDNILSVIESLTADPAWLEKIERMLNQTVIQETLTRLGAIDLSPTIKYCVDENMKHFTDSLIKNFSSTGIQDKANQCELTIMDDMVVVENCLTVKNFQAVDSAQVQNLVVTGSINTDNQSWQALSSEISQQTLNKLTATWSQELVQQVVSQIQQHGVSFDSVKVGDTKLVDGVKLSSSITESYLQQVGTLKTLQVKGEAHFNNNTLNVLNKRLGINTDTPEKALSVWDEEVSVVIGKHKTNQAYVGTNRDQGMTIGVNREPQIEITTDGLTIIKQLCVGLHRLSHATQVPGYSGTRGDLVFNSSPGPDRVFAWVCLGGHKWQTLKSAE
jgi:hypothetical protein